LASPLGAEKEGEKMMKNELPNDKAVAGEYFTESEL